MTKITGILFFFTTFYAAEALKCYDGWQIWGDNPVNNVTLVECLPFHKCCYFVASLPGNNFGCYEKCPPVDQPQCGPDPKSGIQDIAYCYCKDKNDKKCMPYFGDKKRRK